MKSIVLCGVLFLGCATVEPGSSTIGGNENRHKINKNCHKIKDSSHTSGLALEDINGRTQYLTDIIGHSKLVVMSFWGTWCGPCRRELIMLQDIYKQHRDQGLEVLAISTDGPETQPGVRPFVREHGLTFPVLLDTEARAGARYNPQDQIPLMLIFDSKGHIIYSHASFQASQAQVLRNKILELLAVEKK